MKKQKTVFKIAYIALALLICVTPFVCMSFARTDDTTENRRLAAFPALKTEEGFNVDFLSQLGDYFEDHFAFRNRIVALDGKTQALFGVSNAETVVKGTGGWLYYTSTVPDYQRLNVFTDREAFNAAHNLALTRDYVEGSGARFVLTVAPNKNTLYPENMPYYYPAGAGETSIEKLAPLLEEYGIGYVDLFTLFRAQDETLYLQRDSHWNNKGALLAYNALADAAGKAHDTYASAGVTRKKDEIGDLGRMAYSVLAEPEWNYRYDIPQHYVYTTPQADVEAAYIVTENAEANGTLLMFRDSFGNTLIPLLAEAWGKACFSKATPYLLDLYIGLNAPDTVIVEKVERNLADFAKDPPVFAAPEVTLSGEAQALETAGTVKTGQAEADMRFMRVYGSTGTDLAYDVVYVVVDCAAYEAFTVTTGTGDDGYTAFLPEEALAGAENIQIWIKADGRLYEAASAPTEIPEGN